MAARTGTWAYHEDTGVEFEITVTTTTEGDTGVNEVQSVDLTNNGGINPTGGTYTLTFDGQTTGAIAYDANAAAITSALEALSNIAAGEVTVTGTLIGGFTVEFVNGLSETDVAEMTANGASLTGSPVDIVTLAGCWGGRLRFENRATSGAPLYFRWATSAPKMSVPVAGEIDTVVVPFNQYRDVANLLGNIVVYVVGAQGQVYSVLGIPG